MPRPSASVRYANRSGHRGKIQTLQQLNRWKTKRTPTTQTLMGLLLIVAIPIFIGLANKTLRENAEAIHESFGR
jgi:hypothetical protein